MNCPNCQNTMTSSPSFGDVVTVTHTCPHCQHRHVASFNRPEQEYNPFAPKKPVSAVGKILTLTKGYGRYTESFRIIAEGQNRFGEREYIVDQWNATLKRFVSYPANYFQISGITEADTPMTESQIAMGQAYRLQQRLILLRKLIRSVGVGIVHYSEIAVQSEYLGRHTYQYYNDPEYYFGDANKKKRLLILRDKKVGRWVQAMTLAGIPL